MSIITESEKLIELVRGYSFLYDQEDKSYSDQNKKDAAWKEIGRTLNEPAKACKKQWSNLRDCFRRYLKKKRDTVSGQAATKIKKWKYGDEMEFLLPYFQERESVSSLDHLECEIEVPVNEENHSEAANTMEDDVPSDATSVAPSPRKRASRTRKRDGNSASSQLLEYLIHHNSGDDAGEIDFFFKSIAAGVKKLSPVHQIIARTRISSILSELQMEELANNK